MAALLDARIFAGQGPEPPGTEYYCGTCGPPRGLLRMVILPRTEINRATVSRFNRARLEITPDAVEARTIEVPGGGREAIDALYRFDRNLDLMDARFSDAYWEVHRALEGEGRLNHTRDACPDRDGPREILSWTPEAGWRTLSTPK
jgi:hypothetical protein